MWGEEVVKKIKIAFFLDPNKRRKSDKEGETVRTISPINASMVSCDLFYAIQEVWLGCVAGRQSKVIQGTDTEKLLQLILPKIGCGSTRGRSQ